jgi:hypothetical protein|eukprot:CAMPEP_0174325478 /NCGR_PEP_ID=MMETSP0810-20121108/13273_1 /TAXON_ID=73025 ORGANISM="Eutreptiella gymnastica-like, Strain CCMP1594" /NCGR_SAMPLE_ID=MMETSP0810 /ASSEMBLY_ACC=CAM_ASM_000659 /LENGTH=221 /DNA_ID=CAMNT_0015438797 /DNA_START=24 /DNA_END=689 /DNA_ORIENTATION=+
MSSTQPVGAHFQAKPRPPSVISDLFNWKMILSDHVDTNTLNAIEDSAEYFAEPQGRLRAQTPAFVSIEENVGHDGNAPKPCLAIIAAEDISLLNVCGSEVGSSLQLILPTQLTAGPTTVQALPPLKAQGERDATPEDRFPFISEAKCGHHLHFNHLRSKRSYSYYKCDFCNAHWRQLRPKVRRSQASLKDCLPFSVADHHAGGTQRGGTATECVFSEGVFG